jgi:hypothetical protein
MKALHQQTQEIIDRIKNLKEFKIIRNVPDDFELNGIMPYDIRFDNNRMLTVTLTAATQEEAESRVDEFITRMK